LAAAMLAGMGTATPAGAADQGSLNGNFIATSNGEWAKTNDIYHDEASVRSTWTIATVCSYPTECTGTMTSDQGWSSPIYQKSGVWYVKRTVENWQPCPDGTAGPGFQTFRFSRALPDGSGFDPTSSMLIGEDSTQGISGNCGRSPAPFINMPFKLLPA
jgi:hypothetical protein